ncbi:MAPEG family protein [Colwelliaceae bacterium BS250]
MSHLLIQPVILLMLLTMCVWLYMYYLRIGFSLKNKINAQNLSSPEKCNSLLPDVVNQPSNNFKNLFEAPVIFYVVCVLLVVTNNSDMVFVYLAWAYVALRIIHSLIHCTFNNVMARFFTYFISSIVMWVMVCKFAYISL